MRAFTDLVIGEADQRLVVRLAVPQNPGGVVIRRVEQVPLPPYVRKQAIDNALMYVVDAKTVNH